MICYFFGESERLCCPLYRQPQLLEIRCYLKNNNVHILFHILFKDKIGWCLILQAIRFQTCGITVALLLESLKPMYRINAYTNWSVQF